MKSGLMNKGGVVIIGRNHKIESDSMNITLYQRHHIKATAKKPAHDNWDPVGYYATVKNALMGMVNRELRETGMRDFKTVVKKQEELYELITSMS